MTTPSLPAFDPEAALAGVDASPSSGAGAGRRKSRRAGGSAGTPGGRSSRDGSGRGRDGGDATGDGGDDPVRTRSEKDAERRENHPLSDVWGDG
jgi:hypothetical protein